MGRMRVGCARVSGAWLCVSARNRVSGGPPDPHCLLPAVDLRKHTFQTTTRLTLALGWRVIAFSDDGPARQQRGGVG